MDACYRKIIESHDFSYRNLRYELYLSRGAEDGRDLQDWLEAERQLANAPKRRAKKPTAPSPRRRSVKS